MDECLQKLSPRSSREKSTKAMRSEADDSQHGPYLDVSISNIGPTEFLYHYIRAEPIKISFYRYVINHRTL